MRLLNIFLHCLQKCTGLVFFSYFFTKVHQFLLDSVSIITSFLGVIRQASHHFECLSFSSGTLLAAFGPGVFLFLPRPYPVPSPCGRVLSTYLWMWSFSHWSSELCATSSTGDDFPLRILISNLWMTILCAFRSWLASTLRSFFLMFQCRLPPWRGRRGG